MSICCCILTRRMQFNLSGISLKFKQVDKLLVKYTACYLNENTFKKFVDIGNVEQRSETSHLELNIFMYIFYLKFTSNVF